MSATLKVSEILSAIESKAPSGASESWDNVGLLCGDLAWETPGAVISIDLTPESLEQARRLGYRLVINHHPCIFPKGKGPSRLTSSAGGTTALLFEAIRDGIAVIACHTNFDRCALEAPQELAQALKARVGGRLIDSPQGSLMKLVVFTPSSHLEPVREALWKAGCGHIGRYDQCSFGLPGEGTFRAGEGTDPHVGKPGELEKVSEIRLETIFPRGLERPVLEALRTAHPYEEVAYDLYPVEQAPPRTGLTPGLGYGFWGDFQEPRSFPDLAQDVKKAFDVFGFWVTPHLDSKRKFRRVGFTPGKGASFLSAAASAGCDVFITGEVGYHAALDASRRGLAVIELGHRESERFFLLTMKRWVADLGLGAVDLHLPTQRLWTET